MSKLEEVKKIIINGVTNYVIDEKPFPKEEMLSAVIPNLEEVAHQICQLFEPKPVDAKTASGAGGNIKKHENSKD